MIQFGDAENPETIPYGYAALYAKDCDHPCPPGANRWDKDHTRWITFNGDPEASCIDFEAGTACFAQPQIITTWLQERQRRGLTRPAWIYSDLSNAARAHEFAIKSGHPWWWWIPTLDGVQRSAQELSQLLTHWGAPTSPFYVAAQQWVTRHNPMIGSDYDANLCFSEWL